MNMKKITQLSIIIFIVAILGYFLVLKDEYHSYPSVSVGSEAPDFELHTQDGRPFKLSQLRGKVVVLNFWATWCHSCREEIPFCLLFCEQR